MSSNHVVPLAVLAGLSLVSCDVSIHNGDMSVKPFAAEAKQEWSRVYPLTAGGVVEVVNLNGPVDIAVGAADRVEARAYITAKGLSEATAQEMLSKGRIDEAASADHVRVATVAPRGVHGGSYEVRYDVRLPADAHVQVSATNGSLKASGLTGKLKTSVINGSTDLTGISGEVDAISVNGPLSVTLTRIDAPVRLEITNGRLRLELPASSKATLSARVVNGGLSVSGLTVDAPTGNRIRDLDAALNGGGPAVDLRATNGRISIIGK
jgi:Toastrack DUF4097